MSNACSILIAKTIIGDGGSWRGIDDCRALQCFVVLFTSVMTSLMSGSSPSLHLLDPVDGDLGVVLGNVRDRMREPIEESGVRLIWEVGELPTVTPKAILAIPRRKRACGRPRRLDEGPAARAAHL